MYLRIAFDEIDDDSGHELGVFHAVGYLREEGKLHSYEEAQHDAIRAWFNENLEKPSRFTASKPPFYRKPNKAISWFKDTAHEHLGYLRELVGILQNHGVLVQTLTTDRVGYVVCEDDFQIVAEPFAGERYS